MYRNKCYRILTLTLLFGSIIFVLFSYKNMFGYVKAIDFSLDSMIASINTSHDYLSLTERDYTIAKLDLPYTMNGKYWKVDLGEIVMKKFRDYYYPDFFNGKTPKEVGKEIYDAEKSYSFNVPSELKPLLNLRKQFHKQYEEWYLEKKKEMKAELGKYISSMVSEKFARERSAIGKKIMLSALLSFLFCFAASVASVFVFSRPSGLSAAPYDMAKASGRWATHPEIYKHFIVFSSRAKNFIYMVPGLPFLLKNYLNDKNYFPLGKVLGGWFRVGLRGQDRFTHTLICGPTNSGKTSSLIVPGLLQDAQSEVSTMAIDAKSPELYNTVAGAWLKKGKKVILFDPWHSSCIGFNPLPKADNEQILTIVQSFMGNPSKVQEDQKFFRSRTQELLFALIKLTQTFPENFQNLPVTYLLAQNVPDLINKVETCRNEEVKALFKNYLLISNDQKINMLESIKEKLGIFRDEKVQAAFSQVDFDLSILFRERDPALLLVGVPHDKGAIGTQIASLISRLVLNRAFEEIRLKQQQESRGEGPVFTPNPLVLYLDEFPSLNIPDIAEKIRLSRYTKTQLIICVQDLSELEALYIQYKSILGNLRTQIYLSGCEMKTTEYISAMLGKTRTDTKRYSKNVLSLWPGSKFKQWEEDLLMSPDSIHNMPKGMAICFTEHTRPFALKLESEHSSKEIASKIVPLRRSGLPAYRPNTEPLKASKIPSKDDLLGVDGQHMEFKDWAAEQKKKRKDRNRNDNGNETRDFIDE